MTGNLSRRRFCVMSDGEYWVVVDENGARMGPFELGPALEIATLMNAKVWTLL